MQAAISTELYRTKLSNRAPSRGTACLGKGCRACDAEQLMMSKKVSMYGADKICDESTADTAGQEIMPDTALAYILYSPAFTLV